MALPPRYRHTTPTLAATSEISHTVWILRADAASGTKAEPGSGAGYRAAAIFSRRAAPRAAGSPGLHGAEQRRWWGRARDLVFRSRIKSAEYLPRALRLGGRGLVTDRAVF